MSRHSFPYTVVVDTTWLRAGSRMLSDSQGDCWVRHTRLRRPLLEWAETARRPRLDPNRGARPVILSWQGKGLGLLEPARNRLTPLPDMSLRGRPRRQR
jgi:hypothetical protein